MSDHPREQSRMRHIFVCNDILLDIFPFIEPAKVGLKLALLSIRFDALVDLHFKERKWALGHMQIQPSINGAELVYYKDRKKREILPFPELPPPDNIIGFIHLDINYIDHKLFAFLRLIERCFDAGGIIVLWSRTKLFLNWYLTLQELWPLLAPHIRELWIDDNERTNSLSLMCANIVPTVLQYCANLRLINSWHSDHFPGATTADDGPEASFAEAVSKWLHTPREDGRPKVLCSGVSYGEFCWRVEKIKEAFIDANSAVNYIIFLRFAPSCGAFPFLMDNRRTRERLALEFVNDYKWLLARCPIGVDDKWAQWKREEIARSDKDIGMNLITFW
uniref:F-box domain-containing protein n=1 Tax=Globodera pallida TaxID=36090 RepID=A0A183BN90_GLOPA